MYMYIRCIIHRENIKIEWSLTRNLIAYNTKQIITTRLMILCFKYSGDIGEVF